MTKHLQKIFAVIALLIGFVSAELCYAKIPREAANALSEKKYELAIKHLRNHLRRNRDDYTNWSVLGLAYYHSGQPRQALKYLKYSEERTKDRPTNHFFQGLSYLALGNSIFAERYFEKLSYSKNTWTESAQVELIMISYHDQKEEEAISRLKKYFMKFPKGTYYAKMIRVRETLENRTYDRTLQGYSRPDLERAQFKYSPLSLFDTPHFWFIGIGGGINNYSFQIPKREDGTNTLVPSASQDTFLKFRTTMGVGPIRQKSTSLVAGYSYDQTWFTTDERLEIFMKDYTDYAWQPFRTDLLQRDHQFFLDLKSEFHSSFYAGLYAARTYSRLGSKLSGPEQTGVEEALPLSDESVSVPWIGWQASKNLKLVWYWYLEKNLNYESDDLSYKTYSFSLSKMPISLGLSTTLDIPSIKAGVRLDAFHYELIYNDPFLDNTRNGALLSFNHTLFPTFDINVSAGYYVDKYIEPIVKSTGCGSNLNSPGKKSAALDELPPGETLPPDAPDTTPKFCSRKDNGLMFSAQASWSYTQYNRVFVAFRKIANQNGTQKENQFEKLTVVGGVSLAFPSMNKVLRYIERFADRGLERALR
jgi:hypothetical protein